MTPQRYEQAREIFAELRGLSPPQWDVRLAAACGGDEELRAEVNSLLEQHQAANGFLSTPVAVQVSRADAAAADGQTAPPARTRQPAPPARTSQTSPPARTSQTSPPARTSQTAPPARTSQAPVPARTPPAHPASIGNYRIVDLLGEGGMGVVYLAEQISPIRRKVALKVIKLGMDTREIVARFEAERQALAIMDHPNIARVFDAGTAPRGQAYFAMEYVDGDHITRFCDKRRLTTAERLRLFVQVCRAIQHAHQKGVIHRDLKPSNVLVGVIDGKPVPKVIDFGVAKAIGERLTERTLVTEQGRFVGTLEYMSPEQAGPVGIDIDTRTDIYSLGTLLYELLVGTLPFDGSDLRHRSTAEIQRIICEDEPPRPSTRVSSLGPDATHSAGNRGTDPRALRRQLRGDLDWITMKALEKDRSRRYATASDLAEDIERHLRHEPVTAGPPGTVYRVRKFVRRNRALVAGSAAVLIVLVAGIVASSLFALGQARARKEARWKAYVANVGAARMALNAGEIATVRRNLDAAPTEYRSWEWNYLNAASDQSLAVLRGHQDGVMSVMFSPDGGRLVSASEDKTVKVWNIETGDRTAPAGRLLDTLSRPEWGEAYCATFDPDRDRVASAWANGTVCLWDLRAGRELAVVALHRDDVWWVSFSPDGSRLASASMDNTVRVWDAGSLREVAVLNRHQKEVSCVVFNPGGTRLISASYDKTLRVWDAEPPYQILHELRGHELGVSRVAVSPDGALIASTSNDKTVRIWALAAHEKSRTSGESGDSQVSGHPVHVLYGHEGFTSSVAFSPKGDRLASASWDRTIRLWDPVTGVSLGILRGHEREIWNVAFNTDGTLLATASKDCTIRLWDAHASEGSVILAKHSSPLSSVVFSPDGRRVASGALDHTVLIWNVLTGEELVRLQEHQDSVCSIAFSPDGKRLASGSLDGTVRVWDAVGGQELLRMEDDSGGISCVAYSPDGTRLASGSDAGRVLIWDALTGKGIHALDANLDAVDGAVHSVAFSPDGRYVASGADDRRVPIWNTASGQRVRVLPPHENSVSSVAYSPDGTLLASAVSADAGETIVRLWSALEGDQPLLELRHERPIESVAFTADGKRLATAAKDGTVHVWSTASNEELLVLSGDESAARSVAFSPDGTRLASVSYDGVLRIWDSVPHRIRYREGGFHPGAGLNQPPKAQPATHADAIGP
ncbi:MAG: hypothetical protein C4547_09960 [Phycisphaerales bacterium]|nr:MAG: hypothetical protein C4547_09960 [Phycisphaerales bacterium]